MLSFNDSLAFDCRIVSGTRMCAGRLLWSGARQQPCSGVQLFTQLKAHESSRALGFLVLPTYAGIREEESLHSGAHAADEASDLM